MRTGRERFTASRPFSFLRLPSFALQAGAQSAFLTAPMNPTTRYILWIDGAEHGPYTIEQIKAAVSGGTINPQQTARTESSAEWLPLSQIAPLTPAPSADQAAGKAAPAAKNPAKPAPAIGNTSTLVSVVAIFLLVFIAWKAIEAQKPPRFQFMVAAPTDSTFSLEMNELGREGWEIVSARRASSGEGYARSFSYEVILKRRIP